MVVKLLQSWSVAVFFVLFVLYQFTSWKRLSTNYRNQNWEWRAHQIEMDHRCWELDVEQKAVWGKKTWTALTPTFGLHSFAMYAPEPISIKTRNKKGCFAYHPGETLSAVRKGFLLFGLSLSMLLQSISFDFVVENPSDAGENYTAFWVEKYICLLKVKFEQLTIHDHTCRTLLIHCILETLSSGH